MAKGRHTEQRRAEMRYDKTMGRLTVKACLEHEGWQSDYFIDLKYKTVAALKKAG